MRERKKADTKEWKINFETEPESPVLELQIKLKNAKLKYANKSEREREKRYRM